METQIGNDKSKFKVGIFILIFFFGLPIFFSFSMLSDTKKYVESFFFEKNKIDNSNVAKYQVLLTSIRASCVTQEASGSDCAQLALDYIDVNEVEMASLIVSQYSKQNVNPQDDENLKKWSKAFIRVGQIDKSLLLLNEALESRPGNKKILAERSNIFYTLKQFDKAIEDLAHALVQDPDDEEIFGNIISYLKEAGEVKGSEYLEKNKVELLKAIRNPEYATKILSFLVKSAPASRPKSKSDSK
jgi:tetratricopeptide (TPR) repeat protein